EIRGEHFRVLGINLIRGWRNCPMRCGSEEFMALVKCKEFGSEARSKPTKCVKYGAPGVKEQTGARKIRGGFGILIVGSLISGCCVSTYGAKDGHDPMNQAQSCCKDDLQCLAEKAIVAADTYCKDPIERLATHAVRWTEAPN